MDPVLPAFRIVPLLNRTFGPAVPTGMYALVVNWDPQDELFALKNKIIQHGECGKMCSSWKEAYTTALAAITKIEEPLHRKALLRGLTPVPLHLLQASVVERPCGEGDFVGAAYSWQFLNDASGKFNVVVDETQESFEGTHDTRF